MTDVAVIACLRATCLFLWGLVAIVTATSMWRSIRGPTRSNDPWRGLLFVIAGMNMSFLARWYVARSSEATHIVLYLIAAACAVYSLRIVRGYGRGF